MEIRQNLYRFFTPEEVTPKGWMKRQLEIQMQGLAGNLHKVWPDVKDSAWIGGDREGWERVPYWLDGFIPLAFLLRDEEKIADAKRYIDAILAGQNEDGWICPGSLEKRASYDVWGYFIIAKALLTWENCSGDERVYPALYKSLKALLHHVRRVRTLFMWGSARWFECLLPLYRVYEECKEEWLVDLAQILMVQGFNWKAVFDDWRDQKPIEDWNLQTHIVNVTMALKCQILAARSARGKDAMKNAEKDAEKMWSQLTKYHGTGIGHINGDEILCGSSPIHGAELCSLCETLFSCEQNFLATGNPVWLDRMEPIMYNSFPATNSEDMWTHQYDQMVNQISCYQYSEKEPNPFQTNHRQANCFGLEPEFGCCTANMGQAYPKFMLSVFAQKEGEFAITQICPGRLDTTIDGNPISIEVVTDYPFRKSVKVIVKSKKRLSLNLKLYLPKSVENAIIDGKINKSGEFVLLTDALENKEYNIDFTFAVHREKRGANAFMLRYGPLYYALPIPSKWEKWEYEKHGVERKYPYCDYNIFPTGKWNYGLCKEGEMVAVEHDLPKNPFSEEHPAVTLTVKGAEIHWGMQKKFKCVCREKPISRKPISDKVTLTLQPYGSTTLHIAEFPVLDES